jgi:hypothetical protein
VRLSNSAVSGSLAQLVEQLTFNQLVDGSNPSRPTNLNKKAAFLAAFLLPKISVQAVQCIYQ